MPPRLSVILPTCDRERLLRGAVTALVRQTAPADSYEIVVVNNNSTDGTREWLTSVADPRLRVVEEPRQGLSFARNAGLSAAVGELVAFTDDDVEADSAWVDTVIRGLDEDETVDGAGGPVLPSWTAPPPGWLTRGRWAPLALQDHGDLPMVFDARRPTGLVGANVAFRRDVFDRVGGFAHHVQRVRDSIGSTEDHELLTRLYASGGRMRYLPEMRVFAKVQPERCRRSYHRRWHYGHGWYHARMRDQSFERSRARVLGVPAHLWRSAASDLTRLVRRAVVGDWDAAFESELRLRFFQGFMSSRLCAEGSSGLHRPNARTMPWPAWTRNGER